MGVQTTKTTVNTRELIMDMLIEIYAEREYSHILIRNVLDKYNYLGGVEKSFIKRTTEGCVERRIQLDYCINQFSNVPVNKMKPLIRALLRMSVYQILFMDSVPDSAVCNEAVKLAQKRKFTNLKGFVNGVLRNVARNKDAIIYPKKEEEFTKAISIAYSMPEWLVQMWEKSYGKDVTEKLVEEMLQEHPVTVRLDERLSDIQKKEWLMAMEKQGVLVKNHCYLSYAYQLKHTERIGDLPGFEEGMFTVQDVSSMLVAEVSDVKEGMEVIDVCAAPGGKALHVAHKLHETGHLDARDVTDYKVNFIQENIDRMKLNNVETKVWDATCRDELAIGKADILLADVPCSGLGVIGKKRDIKYRVSPESLQQIVPLQKKIIETVWEYVKPNGVMVYSTCTVNKEENERMVQWIVDNFPFEMESLNPYLPQVLHNEDTKNGYLQLLPGIHKADGFFIARLRRKS